MRVSMPAQSLRNGLAKLSTHGETVNNLEFFFSTVRLQFIHICYNFEAVFLRDCCAALIEIRCSFHGCHVLCCFIELTSGCVNLVQDGIGFSHRQSPSLPTVHHGQNDIGDDYSQTT